MDLVGLASTFATGSYTVTRRATRTTDGRGRPVEGASTTLTILASVSPASGMDLNKLPEGRRTTGTITIFTSTQLYIGGVGAAYEADRINANGQTWELMRVETWVDPRSRGTIYKCLAVST